jgi:iron complex outermembrane receptor protein
MKPSPRHKTSRRRSAFPAKWLLSGLASPFLVPVTAAEPAQTDLSQLSLAELLDVPVTVVSRTASPLSHVAGAVHVITQDDIRRSGAQSIAEALRLAPGMEVAQSGSVSWAVSSGGFNDTYANKMLVLRDGRSVYTPLFSGTYWSQQFVVLPDIDKVEVVLGPGASVWGANAVNGVVNIVSKSSFDTLGTLFQAGGGTEELGRGTVRTGALINENTAFRVYAQQEFHDDSGTPSGGRSRDAFESTMGGFRLDWRNPDEAEFMLNGEVYRSAGEASGSTLSFTPPYTQAYTGTDRNVGGFVLGRWQRHFTDTSTLSLEAYYDITRADHLGLSEDRDTGEIGLQYVVEAGERHLLSAGFNYRITADEYVGTDFIALIPQSDILHLPSAFVQDEIALVHDRLTLTVGLKVEGVENQDLELQPALRLAWTPTKTVTYWAAAARAARTPFRAERDALANFGIYPPFALDPMNPFPSAVIVTGNPDMKPEHLVALETGVRWQAKDNLSFDLAAHCHIYDDLRTVDAGTPYFDPVNSVVVLPYAPGNQMHGVTWSGEAGVQWKPTGNSRIRASYSLFQPDLDQDNPSPGSQDIATSVDRSPRHQAMLWGSVDLPGSVELDSRLRYVGELTASSIPSYWELDARVSWRPRSNLELALIGKGLLHAAHSEFGASQYGVSTVADIERSVFAQLTWRF